uniref:Uncharacterized protein n=1 Tax=Arundo donax TaxID=35708 RepID=A0A0A9GT25_ARUDO
MFVAPMSVFE